MNSICQVIEKAHRNLPKTDQKSLTGLYLAKSKSKARSIRETSKIAASSFKLISSIILVPIAAVNGLVIDPIRRVVDKNYQTHSSLIYQTTADLNLVASSLFYILRAKLPGTRSERDQIKNGATEEQRIKSLKEGGDPDYYWLGETALMNACRIGHENAVREMIAQKADLNRVSSRVCFGFSEHKGTAASLSMWAGNVKILDMLVKAGATRPKIDGKSLSFLFQRLDCNMLLYLIKEQYFSPSIELLRRVKLKGIPLYDSFFGTFLCHLVHQKSLPIEWGKQDLTKLINYVIENEKLSNQELETIFVGIPLLINSTEKKEDFESLFRFVGFFLPLHLEIFVSKYKEGPNPRFSLEITEKIVESARKLAIGIINKEVDRSVPFIPNEMQKIVSTYLIS